MEILTNFDPASVELKEKYEAIDSAADLNKPIYGPVDFKVSYKANEKLGNVVYFPTGESEKDYAMLILQDDELESFNQQAKEKGVTMIPLPFVFTIGEMVHGVDE